MSDQFVFNGVQLNPGDIITMMTTKNRNRRFKAAIIKGDETEISVLSPQLSQNPRRIWQFRTSEVAHLEVECAAAKAIWRETDFVPERPVVHKNDHRKVYAIVAAIGGYVSAQRKDSTEYVTAEARDFRRF